MIVTQTACRSVKARPLEMSATVSHEVRCEMGNLAKQSQERPDLRLDNRVTIIWFKKKCLQTQQMAFHRMNK